MPTLMRTSAGKLIFRNGKLGTTPACCCDNPYVPYVPPEDTSDPVSCPTFCLNGIAPSKFKVLLAGFIPHNCVECGELNGLEVTANNFSPCFWVANLDPHLICGADDSGRPFVWSHMGLQIWLGNQATAPWSTVAPPQAQFLIFWTVTTTGVAHTLVWRSAALDVPIDCTAINMSVPFAGYLRPDSTGTVGVLPTPNPFIGPFGNLCFNSSPLLLTSVPIGP